jgi:hypothetical protein
VEAGRTTVPPQDGIPPFSEKGTQHMKTKLYLDVDGVMLRRTPQGFQVANHALTFLDFAIDHFDIYWLTARSHEGNTPEIERAFRHALPNPTASKQDRDALAKIVSSLPTAEWGETKSDAFTLGVSFIWVDDNPDTRALKWLTQRGLIDRLVVVVTDQSPDDLVRVQEIIEPCHALPKPPAP